MHNDDVVTDGELESMEKGSLIQIIKKLKSDLSKRTEDFMRITNLRLYHLERAQNISLQYNRRESFEVKGIPVDIEHGRLEDEVIKIVREAEVTINDEPLKKSDIVACHRTGKKGVVICRVVNRKFAREAIVCSKKLMGSRRYGVGTELYINNSFCPEFGFINFVCRRAAKPNEAGEKSIHRWKVKNGVNHVQKIEGDQFVEIGHVIDLQNIGITVPTRTQKEK